MMDNDPRYGRIGGDMPSRNTQVAMELSEMDGALDELNKALENLSNRLLPLLRESEPVRNNSDKQISPPHVPFVAHLRTKRFMIATIANRINDLVERMEL